MSARTIVYMAAAKGTIPLNYREHAIRMISRWIQDQQDAGKTQTEIGEMLGGLAQGTVSELKAKRVSKLGLRTLFAARKAMGVSLDDLLGLPPLISRDSEPPAAPLAARRAR